MLEPSGDLQMVLEKPAEESVWRVGESVKITGGFHNSAKESVYLDGRLAFKIHLILKVADDQGKEVDFPGAKEKIKLAPPVRDDFVKLASGTSLLRKDITSGNLRFDRPGLYTVCLSGSHGASESYAKSFGIRLGSIGKLTKIKIRVVP
jgi:hypothetical protein